MSNIDNTENKVPDQFIDNEFAPITEEVELPSGGVFYDNEQKTVTIKYLTASEDDILFSPDLINSGKVLDVLLQQGIVKTGIHPDKMLTGDRNAILIALRRTGFGEEYTLESKTCPSCGEKFEPTIDLSEFKVKKLTVKPDENGEFEVDLPLTKKNIKFRMLTGEDERFLGKLKATPVSGGGKSQAKFTQFVTQKYTRQIMEVDGQRDKTYIRKFVMSMPTKDSLFFREYVKNIEPGLEIKATLECPHCGHVYEEKIVLDPIKLFYPDA